jgi:hypothetical protein
MKLCKTKPATKRTQTSDKTSAQVRLEYLSSLDEEARTKPNKKRISTVEVTVDYLNALRREVGRYIDPDTAEVDWVYAQVLDPYGDNPNLPEELQCTGRAYFARCPGTNVWICFDDLPDRTSDKLLKKTRTQARVSSGTLGFQVNRRIPPTELVSLSNRT